MRIINNVLRSKIIAISILAVLVLGIMAVILYNNIAASKSKYNSQGNIVSKIIDSHSSASWISSNIIIWNNKTYIGSNEKIIDIDKKLGTIEYYSDKESQTRKNNFSNTYKKDTELYKIKNVDAKNAIAVKTDNGYIKAVVKK